MKPGIIYDCDELNQGLTVYLMSLMDFCLFWDGCLQVNVFFSGQTYSLMGYASAKDAYGRPPDLLTENVTEFQKIDEEVSMPEGIFSGIKCIFRK